MVQSVDIYTSLAHLTGAFELPTRVTLKLFLGGLGKLFTTLKAGNNSHFCDMFKLPNRVILKLFFNFVKVVSKLYLRLLDFT